MARGMNASSGADVALASPASPDRGGTPDAKPVGLVYIAIAGASGTRVDRAQLAGLRATIKDRAGRQALNLLRLYLEGVVCANG